MEKIINKLINDFTEGVDTYTHNGSTWLIFTESKQWVIELTENKTLWYNYNFFKSVFSYTSMDVVDNQHYITKWVEDNIINKVERTSQSIPIKSFSVDDIIQDAVKHTYIGGGRTNIVEDTLQDGVIKTKGFKMRTDWSIEDTIENGIKETRPEINITEGEVDDIIQDGVKETNHIKNNVRETKHLEEHLADTIDGVINEGVKETIECDWNIPKYVIDEVVNDGVKYTFPNSETGTSNDVERVIKNGVKDTYSLGALEVTEKEINNTLENGVKWTQFNDYENKSEIEGVIKKGVKLTGRIHKDYTEVVEYLIENGVKETKRKNNALLILDNSGRELILESHLVIRDGVKETSHRQFLKTYDVKDTIQDGTEHDRWILDGCADPVDVVLENGVKETIFAFVGGSTLAEDVLQNGVRSSHPLQYRTKDMIDKVIAKGVIETYNDVYHHKGRIDSVIKNGVKETHGEIREYKQTIGYIIQTGVKETKTPGNGDLFSTFQWMEENKTNSVPKMINDVIENGVKEIIPSGCVDKKTGIFNYRIQEQVDDVVDNGEKVNGTFVGGKRQKEDIESVIGYGTKNPTD